MAEDMDLSTPKEDEKNKTLLVHLRGELSKPPGPLLWILKWLLTIPHIVVLPFLFIPVPFVTIIGFFGIIFARKYPKKLFNFVVGVFRWYWRVRFYGSAVLGTDKYPPFSLKPREDYPADFHIDYPERFKRLLPLVKWFLVILHYVILLAFFLAYRELLLFVVRIALLFTGRYPKGMFRVVVGINRWFYRTTVYVLLLTDEFPRFSLVK